MSDNDTPSNGNTPRPGDVPRDPDTPENTGAPGTTGTHGNAGAPENAGTPENDEWTPVEGTPPQDPPAPGEPAADPPRPDPSPQTEKFDQAPTVPAAQAYSQVPLSEQDTTDFAGPGHPGTARFGPGEDPYGADTPATGPATTGAPVVTSPAKRRSVGKIVAFSVVGVLLLVVIGAVGSELYLRNKVTGCLEESFSGLTGVPTEVSLSRKPIIMQGTGNIPFVQVDTDDSAGGVRLHMRADGISANENTTDIRTLDGTGYIPFERVVELSKEAIAAQNPNGGAGPSGPAGQTATIESVTGNAADGTFEVQAGFPVMFFSVPVSATIRPELTPEGRVEFTVEKASALVFGIPPDFAQQIVDQVTTSSLGPFFDEVRVDDLKVTDDGLDFAISGSDVTLTGEMMSGSGSEQQSGGCSL